MSLFGNKYPPEVAARVPPGQRLVKTWPILHFGGVPRFDDRGLPWNDALAAAMREVVTEPIAAVVSADLPRVTAADNGVRLHGCYNVMLRNDSEVLVQWAVDDVATFTATMHSPEEFPALTAWRQEAAELERSHAGVLLKPTSWSPLR